MRILILFFVAITLVSCNTQKKISGHQTQKQSQVIQKSYGPGGKIIRRSTIIVTDTSSKSIQVVPTQAHGHKEVRKPKLKPKKSYKQKKLPRFIRNGKFKLSKNKTSKASLIGKNDKLEKDRITNVAMTFSILALLTGWIPFFGWVIILTAIILSIVAMSKGKNKKKARNALIISLISIIVSFGILLIIAFTL